MHVLHLFTVAALLVQAPMTRDRGPLGPLSIMEPEGGPEIVLRPYEAAPLVAIRLSVPITGPVASGAVRALQQNVRSRMRERAARHGARVRLTRTPTHAVYAVVGPARSFMDFAGMLRDAVGDPGLTPKRMMGIRSAVAAEILAELDTPEPRLRRRLRAKIFGEMPDGIGGTIEELEAREVQIGRAHV